MVMLRLCETTGNMAVSTQKRLYKQRKAIETMPGTLTPLAFDFIPLPGRTMPGGYHSPPPH